MSTKRAVALSYTPIRGRSDNRVCSPIRIHRRSWIISRAQRSHGKVQPLAGEVGHTAESLSEPGMTKRAGSAERIGSTGLKELSRTNTLKALFVEMAISTRSDITFGLSHIQDLIISSTVLAQCGHFPAFQSQVLTKRDLPCGSNADEG